MAMERERRRGRTRRKQSSPVKRFLYQEGRRYCAMLLSLCLILGNMAGTAFAASSGEEPTFRISRTDLYEALQQAVKEGNQPKEIFSFQGEEALEKAYQDLLDLEMNEDLYELSPKIRKETNDVELRIFACLDQGADPEKRYEIAGDEKIIFLVTNKTEQEQEATIQVDQKITEPITVLPGTMLIVEEGSDQDQSSADEEGSTAGGNSAGGGGAGGSGAGGSGTGGNGGAGQMDTESDGTAKETDAEESGKDDENTANTIKPEGSLGDQEESEDETKNDGENTSDQEEALGTEEASENDSSKNDESQETDRTESELEQESKPENKNDGKDEADKENGSVSETNSGKEEANTGKEENDSSGKDEIKTEDTKNENGDNSAKGEDSSGKDDAGKDENASDSAGKSEGSADKGTSEKGESSSEKSENHSEKSENRSEKSEQGKSENTSDGGKTENKEDSSREKEVSLWISPNQVQRVTSMEDEEATSSNAVSKEQKASKSEALSDNEQVLEGEIYPSILLEKEEKGAAVFVTTAANLGLDDDSFKLFTVYENNELKDVTVRVAAEAGVLPDDVTLQVKELKEEGELAEQYKEAEEALKKEGTPYDGMMALDICFLDPDGNEIEPSGNVQVSIKVNADSLPEDIDPESLSVQHLKEEHDGSVQVNQVADVADATDGIVEVNKDEAIAEFSVDSFSSFTITWVNGSSQIKKINIYYVNTNEEQINEPTHDQEIQDEGTILLTDYSTNAKTDLTYKGAYYGDINGAEIDSISAKTSGWINVTRKLEFKKGEEVIKTITMPSTEEINIYLVYEASVVVKPPEVIQDKGLSHFKTATLKNDGTYDLALSVKGAVSRSSDKYKMDILFIVDKSGSMKESMSKFDSTKRIKAVADAVESLTTIIDRNQGIDARYSVVSFSDRDKTKVDLGWTDNAELCSRTINSISPKGGTNYQAGILKGKEQLDSGKVRGDADRIVIFLTDGLPTYRNYGNDQAGSGQGDYDCDGFDWLSGEPINPTNKGANINAAVEEIKGMGCTDFYAIGCGPDFTNNSTASNNLKNLCENVAATGKKQSYTASNASALNKAFRDISANTTSIECDQVKITDTLSDNVFPILNEDGKPKKLEVTVTDEKGISQVGTIESNGSVLLKNGSVKVVPSYNATSKTLSLHFEPESYKLQENWVYTVTMSIDATEAAYQKYRNSEGSYEDKPDDKTGTHAENNRENGYYSNTNAVLSYRSITTQDGEQVFKNKSELFAKPVIQLHPGELIIQKTIDGLDNEQLEVLKEQLEFDVELTWVDENGQKQKKQVTPKLKEFELKDGTYQYGIKWLSPNTSYKIEERGADIAGYTLTTKIDDSVSTDKVTNGTIEKGKTKIVGYTNTYQKTGKLTVKKQVTGNMGDKKQTFRFKYTVNGAEQGTFDLKHNETRELFNIPSGAEVVITELGIVDANTNEVIAESLKDYQTTATVKSNDITENPVALPGKAFSLTMLPTDTEVIFTNEKSISAPTGLSNNKHPYLWMLAIATFGLMGCSVTGLSKKARKVRNDE